MWTEHVASFGVQLTDPPGDHPARTPPAVEQQLWQHGPHQLSTHRAWIDDGVTRGTPQELPLWTVADVEVTTNGGRVAVHVAYPGYGGRAHYVMTRLPEPAQVGALVKRWAARNRRAAGLL